MYVYPKIYRSTYGTYKDLKVWLFEPPQIQICTTQLHGHLRIVGTSTLSHPASAALVHFADLTQVRLKWRVGGRGDLSACSFVVPATGLMALVRGIGALISMRHPFVTFLYIPAVARFISCTRTPIFQ